MFCGKQIFAKQTKQFKTRKSLLQKKPSHFCVNFIISFFSLFDYKNTKIYSKCFWCSRFRLIDPGKKTNRNRCLLHGKRNKEAKVCDLEIWETASDNRWKRILPKNWIFFYISRCSTQQTNNTQSKTNSTYKTWILFTPLKKTFFLICS